MIYLSWLFLFSLGVLLVGVFPFLPSILWFLCAIPLSLIIYKNIYGQYFLALLCGVFWGVWSGYGMLKHQLPETFVGKPLQLEGRIEGIPFHGEDKIRFVLAVDTWQNIPLHDINNLPKKIQLSWYQPEIRVAEKIIPNNQFRVTVKLKRPRSMVNFSGMDYHAWLLRNNIGAVGSVIALEEITNSRWGSIQSHVDSWRWHLQQWITSSEGIENTGVLTALLIGENDFISQDQWRLMQRTGISHLIAISGLHIGFLAIVGYIFGGFLGRLVQLVGAVIHRKILILPAPKLACFFSILFSGFYSALAGFNIPTLRTFIMIVLFNLAFIIGRRISITFIYATALTITLLIDPLAGYDMGFWLSYGAVGLLLIYFSGRYSFVSTASSAKGKYSYYQHIFLGFIKSQWLMLIGLFLPLVLLINTTPLLSPLTNLIAIPLITFCVVPLLLIGAVINFISIPVSEKFLSLADFLLIYLVKYLSLLLSWCNDWATPVISFHWSLGLLVAIISAGLLLPSALGFFRLSAVGFFALMAIMYSEKKSPPLLQLTALDVGQGTAIVIKTANQTLVYDVGPAYSDKFDAATGILMPYLHSQGISSIDKLIISHWDSDHAGGLRNLLPLLSVDTVLNGEPARKADAKTSGNYWASRYGVNLSGIDTDGFLNCHEYPSWRDGDIKFSFLTWNKPIGSSANNQSCVLRIHYQSINILLMGDIEKEGEYILMRGNQLPQNVSVLVAGHHGSRSSSTPSFAQYVKPKYVVYSAGYKNAYNHPHPSVVDQFDTLKSEQLNTAERGAIEFIWQSADQMQVREARTSHRKYWFD